MKIFLSTKADKQLANLPQKMHDLMIAKIKTLAHNPFLLNSKKLTNRQGWRIRIGDYRILYAVDNKKKELTILSVAHRKDVYRF